MINVLLNILLFVIKFIGGKISRSVSVTADAFNNLTDAGTTLAAMFGVKVASLGSGEHHPNGHGRFEWVIALLTSTSVIIVGWELAGSSISAIRDPEDSEFRLFTFIVLLISISVKLFMYFFNSNKAKKNDVQSLKAIAMDSLSDAVATGAVFISQIINLIADRNIDGYCGILVALFIMYSGIKSFTETSERIMGRAPSKEELNELRDFVLEQKDYDDIYNLQIEDYGYGRHRTTMNVLAKEEITADQLLIDVAETTSEIYKKYGYDVIISPEISISDPREEEIRAQLTSVINSFNIEAKLLSVRISDAVHTRLVRFEVGIPHEYFREMDEFEEKINKSLEELPGHYSYIPKVKMLRVHGINKHRRR